MRYRLFAAIAALCMLVSSCKTSENSLTYFEDIEGVNSGILQQIENTITIRPADELLITVSSVTPEATAEYNAPLVNPALASSLNVNTQPQQQTYIVNQAGDITMPVVGKIIVASL